MVAGVWQPYSALKAFTLASVPTALSPAGAISDTTPSFSFTRIVSATQYKYQLLKAGVPVYTQLVLVSACGATANCVHTPVTALVLGSYSWKVQAQVGGVWGLFSPLKAFTISVPQTLTVSKTGSAAGIVTSSPAGINCGATCSHSFPGNTVVTLKVSTPGTFAGWSGAGCTGLGTCVVTMSAARSVSAAFNPTSYAAVSTGGHTCGLTTAGSVRCWGNNASGELGNGTYTNSNIPVAVSALASGVSAVASGGSHTCALLTGGAVKCWGGNSSGQLGNGTNLNSKTPVAVSALTGSVSAIRAGNNSTCALTTGGAVKCWGKNNWGQLGDGTLTDRNTPVAVSGLGSGIKAISLGQYHACALTTAGGVKCWGLNWNGQLGNDTISESKVPVAVTSLASGVSAVAEGYGHTCALSSAGGLKCWGGNGSGQLGDGTYTDSITPVDVSGLSSGVDAITAGSLHTCALISGGIQCWGINLYGQLGDGTNSDSKIPVAVVGLSSGVSAISAGSSYTCAVTTNGGLKCWGWNDSGALGNGTNTSSNVPVSVVGSAP